jgi:outer membrane biosynthesis protein TonB
VLNGIAYPFVMEMKNIKAKILAVSLLVILLAFLTLETRAANVFYEETTPATTEQTEATTGTESIKEETTNPTDDITEDTTTTPTETETEPVVEETTVPVKTKPEETKPTEPEPTVKPTEPKPTTPPSDKHSDTKNYIGRFKISSVGVNVACYAGSEQSIVDAQDSAAYFYGFGHIIIGDHKHQGFSAIKSCSVGTKARMVTKNGTETFTCVGKIQGHNTGYELTDANYVPINNLYPGSIACYTCNDNWKNVTIVFFMPDSEMNKPSQPEEPKEEPVYGCGEGRHKWTDWKIEWEGVLDDGRKFHWESHECMVCYDEEWECVYDSAPEPTPEPEPEPEPTPEPTQKPTEAPEIEGSKTEETTSEQTEETELEEPKQELTEQITILN